MYIIVYVSIFVSFCWLTGRTHEFAEHLVGKPFEKQLGALLMVVVSCHILYALKDIIADPSLFVDKKHMMNIYSIFLDERLPLKTNGRIHSSGKETKVHGECIHGSSYHSHLYCRERALQTAEHSTLRVNTDYVRCCKHLPLITTKENIIDKKKSTF